MNSERFLKFLKDKELPSSEELQELLVNYPFCENLRLLQLRMDLLKNANNESRLSVASLYSIDRSKLKKLTKRWKVEHPGGRTEVSSERSAQALETLLRKYEEKKEESVKTDQKLEVNPVKVIESSIVEEIEDTTDIVVESKEEQTVTHQKPIGELEFHDWLETLKPVIADVRRKKPMGIAKKKKSKKEEKKDKPSKKKNKAKSIDGKAKSKKKKSKKKKKDQSIKKLSAESLKIRKEMASETLAELLVSQNRFGEAIDVYKRLSLIFPEKSSFFAKQIKNLKKKL
jgi:hypothetical protein